MRCELSEFIKGLLLLATISLFFSSSFPVVHIFGEKVIPGTSVAIKVRPSNLILLNSFSTHANPETRTIFYEKGKKITFTCDGKIKTLLTRSKTFQDFLKSEKVILSQFDLVSHSLQAVIREDDHVTIKRINYAFYDFDEPIPYETVFEKNALVAKGIKVVWIPGEDGLYRHKVKDKFEDGILKQRTILSKKCIKNPIKEVIAYGSGEFTGPYKTKLRMYASSYNPTVEQCGENPFTTATGVRVRFGVVAVDPTTIKLGSRLWVSGYGFAIAADTGGLIKGMRIDLFFWRRLPDENWKGWAIDVYVLD